MRPLRLSAAISLDGCIAGPGGEFDWIDLDPEIDFAAMMSRFDVAIMGRKSYQAVLAHGPDVLPKMETLVVSRTLQQDAHSGITIVRDPASTIKTLKTTPGKDIWLYGGGELFRSMLEADLVDEIELAIMPIILGRGIPLLPHPATRMSLKLVQHRIYTATGTVMLEYRRAVHGHV
jgi:dihydrofolate reductase